MGKYSARLTAEAFNGRKGFRVRFYDVNRERRSIWLGDVRPEVAETWRGHVEHLSRCLIEGAPYCGATTSWLHALEGADKEKLARVGLIPKLNDGPQNAQGAARRPTAAPRGLRAFIDWYISRRNVKLATSTKWKQTRDALVRYFGPDRDLTTITAGDAEAWREWLGAEGNIREGRKRKDKAGDEVQGRTQLADNTVRRRTGIARQFFNSAIKSKLMNENPFHGLAASVHGNEARQFFVTHELFRQVIGQAPGAEFGAILALSRLGGLRVPSEVHRLKWEDIDFGNGRICIHASKTEHHSDGGVRYCPLFVELRPYLEDLAALAKSRGAGPRDWVITEHRGSETLIRRKLLRVLNRAGISPWPKLFHNMRASRETELLDTYPIKDVCGWIGNSQAVAMKHYAMRRQDAFARAAGLTNECRSTESGWSVGWSNVGNSGRPEATEPSPQPVTDLSQLLASQGVGDLGRLVAALGEIGRMGGEGPELSRRFEKLPRTSEGFARELPTFGQSVGQLLTELQRIVSSAATREQLDALYGALLLIFGASLPDGQEASQVSL